VPPAQCRRISAKSRRESIQRSEREKHGVIAGSLHAPCPDLAAKVRPGGMLNELH